MRGRGPPRGSTDIVERLVEHLIEPGALAADKVLDKVLGQVAVPYRECVPETAPASSLVTLNLFRASCLGRNTNLLDRAIEVAEAVADAADRYVHVVRLDLP